MDKMHQQQLDFILKSAIQAPSADNRHKIRFEVIDNIIHIHHTGAEFPPKGGYKWALALLSLGAMVENISLAASRFSFRTEVTSFTDPYHPNLVARISLHPDQATNDPLWEIIPLRHTNRSIRFHGPNLTDREKEELNKTIHTFPACELTWLDQPALRKQAIHLMRLAETERFRNPLLHEELFSAIRFDIGWHTTCAEGLPPGALGVEPPLRGFFSLLRHWPVMRLTNFIGMHYMLGLRSSYIPCRLAPHLGALSVKKTDTQSVLQTGRAFQRLWLALTKQGYVLQPMPASAIYAMKNALDEGITDVLHHVLSRSWQDMLNKRYPLMLFRLGKAKQHSILTTRPEAAYFHKENNSENWPKED